MSDDAVTYDNLAPTPCDDHPGMIEVERIYCVDERAFRPGHWDAIATVYRGLPGGFRQDPEGSPMWFGTDEDAPPFLWASAEPPGIQVYGVLALADWHAWDSAFRAGLDAASVPFRDRSAARPDDG